MDGALETELENWSGGSGNRWKAAEQTAQIGCGKKKKKVNTVENENG